MAEAERLERNFDEPAALEVELLARHLEQLRRGEAVFVPQYDFTQHTRVEGGNWLEPRPLIFLEGIFALALPEVQPLLDLRIFVETPEQVCYQRRVVRDAAVRKRSPEETRQDWETWVGPSLRRWIWPSRKHAELIVSGEDLPRALLTVCDKLSALRHEKPVSS